MHLGAQTSRRKSQKCRDTVARASTSRRTRVPKGARSSLIQLVPSPFGSGLD